VTSCGGAAAIEHPKNEERSRRHRRTLAKMHCKSDHPWSPATVRVTSSHRPILGLSRKYVQRSNKPPNSNHVTDGYSKSRINPNTSSRRTCGGAGIYRCNYFLKQNAYTNPCTNTERQRGVHTKLRMPTSAIRYLQTCQKQPYNRHQYRRIHITKICRSQTPPMKSVGE
jgi:hypothetical protein